VANRRQGLSRFESNNLLSIARPKRTTTCLWKLLFLCSSVRLPLPLTTLSTNSQILANKFEPMFMMVFDSFLHRFSFLKFLSVIRSGVPKITLDALFESKDDLAHKVRENLSKVMVIFLEKYFLNIHSSTIQESYGYEIIQTLVIDIRPARNVAEAMNEINANLRLRVAAGKDSLEKNLGTMIYIVYVADKAEAEKIEVVKNAEADAESKYLNGVGIAR
jgi:hypothetical protein